MKTDDLRQLPMDESILAATVREWRAARPGMGIFALLPEAEKDRLPLLQSVCRQQCVPLVGGIFPELVTSDGFVKSGVWLLRLDDMVPAFLIPGLATDPTDAAARVADTLLPALPRVSTSAAAGAKPTLYLVVDALLPNIASLLDGLYLRLADRVAYAGVAAGSEAFQPMPCVFDGERVIDQGALAMLLPGDSQTILKHGFRPPDKVMTATSTVGNRIIQIDWRPAFDVYRDIVRAERGVELTRENFYEWAVHFPFGILRANGETVVRIPVALTDDGGVFCIGEVPENAMLVVLRAPGLEDGLCVEQLAAGLGNADSGLLLFYCAGRRLHLGGDANAEIRKLAERTQARCIAGALSLGELGSTTTGGYPLFHNATLVCTPWRHR